MGTGPESRGRSAAGDVASFRIEPMNVADAFAIVGAVIMGVFVLFLVYSVLS